MKTGVGGARCTPGCTSIPDDPRLAAIVQALLDGWAGLPEPTRLAVEATVRGLVGGERTA